MKQFSFYAVFSAIGGFIVSLMGGLDTALSVLLTLMVVDFVMGVLNAMAFKKSKKSIDGRLTSDSMTKGLIKKGSILLVVLVSYQLELVTNMNIIRACVISGFSASECLSIIETAGLMGVPIPPVIVNAISVLKSSSEKR